MRSGTELARVQIPRDICARLGRYLCSWITILHVNVDIYSRDPMVFLSNVSLVYVKAANLATFAVFLLLFVESLSSSTTA